MIITFFRLVLCDSYCSTKMFHSLFIVYYLAEVITEGGAINLDHIWSYKKVSAGVSIESIAVCGWYDSYEGLLEEMREGSVKRRCELESILALVESCIKL